MSEKLSLGDILTFHARRDPKRPSVTIEDQSLTRGELEARANRRAREMAAAGIGHGDFVTILLPNCIEYFEMAYGIWKLGAVPQPLSADLPQAELDAILDLVKPRLVITNQPARAAGYPTLAADRPVDESLSAEPLPSVVPPYWRATTSGGSTGRPKVIVDHGATLRDPLAPMMGQRVDGVQLNPGPLYHSGPFGMVNLGIFSGAHVVNMKKFDPLRMLELVERHRVDWLYLVPTMMHRIFRLPAEERERFDVSSLRTVFHMAAACPDWLKQSWIDWLGPETIWELYSSTESIGVAIINGTDWLAHRGSVGRVLPGSTLSILDEAGQPCPPGTVGEIYFKPDAGPGTTYHYIGATPRAVGQWETPGDLGYVDEDGWLFIVDRRTDLIVSGGANVYPAEVEAAIEAHPDVACAVAIGLPDEDLGHRVHALVELKPGSAVSADDLWNHVAGLLLRYKVPRQFEFVDAPLRDSAGKVRRSALREERIRAAEMAAQS